MLIFRRLPLLLPLLLVLLAGCSVFPGARVLLGQDDTAAVAAESVDQAELVMADKGGNTNPSLAAAADRIEAANSRAVDIIELKNNEETSTFEVSMLLEIPQGSTNQQQFTIIRRALELTWQGTLRESQGDERIRIQLLSPLVIPTLDGRLSFAGEVIATSEILRAEAVAYLGQRPLTDQDFSNLVAEIPSIFVVPEQQEIYQGTPNHPSFLLQEFEAQITAAS
ncbi:MAG TPA: hypothetical protein PLQ56_04155 [Aggregatilineales bacterium]|nr:hypothetical protein [Anaerolineae bacterium]HUN05762.1 hypothetical protein [Aggregatilineales bacterium]